MDGGGDGGGVRGTHHYSTGARESVTAVAVKPFIT